MRKIKYAGIATAALLAVAPVATTAVNPAANTVQAATAATNAASSNPLSSFFDQIFDQNPTLKKVYDTIKSAVDKIQQQNENKEEAPKTTTSEKVATAVKGLKNVTYNKDNPVNMDMLSFFADNLNQTITTQNLTDGLYKAKAIDDDTANEIKADGNKYEVKISAGDTTSAADLNKIMKAVVDYGNGMSFPINITITDPANKDAVVATKTLTFTNNTEETVPSQSLAITYTTPISLAVGSSSVDQTLSTSVDAKATNETGANVKYSANAGDFYTNYNDAKNKNTNTVNVGPTFQNDGATYYQPVTLTFDKDAADVTTMLNKMIKDRSASLTLNGDNASKVNVSGNTVTYVRAIQIGSAADNNNTNNNNNNSNDNNNTNTDDSVWVEDNAVGTVTVGNSTASLYDDDNNVTNRALASNSAWATDKSRVNSKTGLKQYHVSTHEWVNASNVNFVAKNGSSNNNTSSTTGLNNITDLSGHNTINLAGPQGFVYALYSASGARSNRGLAGATSWYTDKSATDNAGNTYYRVSTDEWVRMSTGVTLN